MAEEEHDLVYNLHNLDVHIGIKPLPITSALLNTYSSTLISAFTSLGYNHVVLPITNARYRENCKLYFQKFVQSTHAHSGTHTHTHSSGAHNQNDLNSLNVKFPDLTEINLLHNSTTAINTVGLLSSWIELDSNDPLISEFSLQVVYNELSYASHLGIPTVLMAPPKSLENLSIFTANLSYLLAQFPNINISISLPICEEFHSINSLIDPLSTWDFWNAIRIQCNYNNNLSVSLASPKQNIPQSIVNRWLLEPIKFYLLSASRFIPNSKRYPVLNKFNQLIIWKIIQSKALNPPILLLHGVDTQDEEADFNLDPERFIKVKIHDKTVYLGDLAYYNYLRHLCSSSSIQNNQLLPIQNFTLNNFLLSANRSQLKQLTDSSDTLQVPLQPLNNNLNNQTYKLFEKDRAKYEAYEKSIIAALLDLISIKRFQHIKRSNEVFKNTTNNNYSNSMLANPSSEKLPSLSPYHNDSNSSKNSLTFENLKILIVGPGRGPLIEKVFSAMKFLNLDKDKISVTAIEKNPNVMIYLTQRNQSSWENRVEIINKDVRNYIPKLPNSSGFHLVVSELLGSFGCNELSPECLDSIEQYCDVSHRIFIPKQYSSYIAPAISPSIYKKIDSLEDYSKFNTLFVPLIDQVDILSSKYGKAWTFHHPTNTQQNNNIHDAPFPALQHHSMNGRRNKHNKRVGEISLKCHRKGMIHGILGYFEAELYNGITLSNCPTGKGPEPSDLISWLPCFFPLDKPIYISDDQEVSILMKRDSDDSKVWYEWSVQTFMYLAVPQNQTQGHSDLSQTNSRNSNISQAGGFGNHAFTMTPRSTETSTTTTETNADTDVNMNELTPANTHQQASNSSSSNDDYDDEVQMRVRTGISRIHNANGKFYNLKL